MLKLILPRFDSINPNSVSIGLGLSYLGFEVRLAWTWIKVLYSLTVIYYSNRTVKY